MLQYGLCVTSLLYRFLAIDERPIPTETPTSILSRREKTLRSVYHSRGAVFRSVRLAEGVNERAIYRLKRIV